MVHVSVTGNEVRVARHPVPPLVVSHLAAGFPHQQGTNGPVPRSVALFPVGIQLTGGDPCRVQTGAADAADITGLGCDLAELGDVVVCVLRPVGSEAGGYDGPFEAAGFGDLEPGPAHEATAP